MLQLSYTFGFMCLFGYLGLANYFDLDVVVRLLRCLFGVVVCGFYCGSVVIVAWFVYSLV